MISLRLVAACDEPVRLPAPARRSVRPRASSWRWLLAAGLLLGFANAALVVTVEHGLERRVLRAAAQPLRSTSGMLLAQRFEFSDACRRDLGYGLVDSCPR
jgi:hypothetical protein